MSSPACLQCATGRCIGGHVYVIEVRSPGAGLTYVVGHTGKTVEERFEEHLDPDEYTSVFVRNAGRENVRLAVELFADRNPVAASGDQDALEDAEGRLADELHAKGLSVRFNMLGKRPR